MTIIKNYLHVIINECLLTFVLIGQGSRLPQSIEMDKRPNQKFKQGFSEASAAAGGSENSNRPPGSLPEGVRDVFLHKR